MNFSELIQNRTSVRSFRDKTVKNDLIEKIVSESLEAPTSCNQQLQKYIVVNDKELLNSLVDECGGVEHIKHAPIAVVMLYQLGWNHKRGSHIQSLGAIVDHLILSATDNGLSCVWNAGIGNDGKIRETLKIPAEFGIFCIVSIGYKSDTKVHKKPPRNNLSYFLSYNEFTFKNDKYYPISVKRNQIKHCHNPDKWSCSQIMHYRAKAIYAGGAKKYAYIGKQNIQEFNYELQWLKKSSIGEKWLFIMAHSCSYVFELLSLISEPKNIFLHELSNMHEEFFLNMMDIYKDRIKHHSFTFVYNTNFMFIDTFETVFIVNSVEYLPTNHKKELIDQTSNIVKKNGVILTSYINKFSWYYLYYIFKVVKVQVSNKGPFSPINPFFIKKRFKKMHYVNNEVLGLTVLPFEKFIGQKVNNFFLKIFSKKILESYIKK